eukprot:scaffold4119_cov127-Skeletonema_dohrnii-CCMP3373.AAC.3
MSTSRPRPFAARRAFVGCAAAFGTLSSSTCWAFVQPHRSTLPASSAAVVPSSVPVSSSNYDLDFNSNINYVLTTYPNRPARQQQSTRLFFSMRNNNNNNEDDDWKTLKKAGGNILKKAGSKIKSIIPFGSKTEEEKLAKQRKAEIKGGINTMLKDMPLPVRLMGRMVAPMLSKAADQIAEQSRQAEDMMEEARVRIVNDPAVKSKLGEPVQVGQPFSQSSSTMVINGKSSARINMSFQVGGPYGNGVATMESADGEIVNLVVNVNGMNINVGGSGGYKFGSSSPSSSSSSSKKGDIIEAEIIKKK